jgi:hypothetical protein
LFIHFFKAFLRNVRALGSPFHKKHYGKNWAKGFSEDYSITYRPSGEKAITKIRNDIVHEPGPEKDEAKRLAKQYADSFGGELLKTIKKIINETLSQNKPPSHK